MSSLSPESNAAPKIVAVAISNFRSIRKAQLRCADTTALIGANNGGKSNILRAIRWALDPDVDLGQADLSPPGPDSADNLTPSVQVDLAIPSPLTGGVGPGDTTSTVLRIRRSWDGTRSYYEREQAVPEDPSLRIDAIPARKEDLARVPYGSDFDGSGKLTTRENHATLNRLRERYIDRHRSSLQFVREFERVDPGDLPLPEIIFLPAVRELSDTTGMKARSIFRQHVATQIARHLGEVTEIREATDKIGVAFQTLVDEKSSHRKQAVSALEEELRSLMIDWDASFDIDFDPPRAPAISDYLQPTIRLLVDDGISTPPEEKGHGFQRALLLELIQLESKLSGSQRQAGRNLRLLLIEEPELYLHPQKQRALSFRLRHLAAKLDHQVLLATHSDAFIDLAYPDSIARVEKTESGTEINQPEDIFAGDETEEMKRQKQQFNMAYWFSQGRAQMLFARKTVFVEGQTEVALFSRLAERLNVYDPEVALIDCGSKDNLPIYCQVARSMKLSFIVVHDEDLVTAQAAEPPSCPECANRFVQKRSEKNRARALNDHIQEAAGGADVVVMRPNVDGELGVSKRQGEKLGKPMAAIRHLEGLQDSEIPARLIEAVKKIFA